MTAPEELPLASDGDARSGTAVPRLPLFPMPDMTPDQQRVHEQILAGPRTALVGPLRAALHRPELADRWQRFGELLRYDTTIPAKLKELAILVTARRWNAQLEWHVHAEAGLKAGLRPDVVETLRAGGAPVFHDDSEADVYEFVRSVQLAGDVDDEVYARLLRAWGPVGVVELSSVVGYYTLVSITLNVHAIPLPDGLAAPLRVLPGKAVGTTGNLRELPHLPTCVRAGGLPEELEP